MSDLLSASSDCDDCTPKYLKRSLDSVPPSTILFHSLPFLLTWLAVVVIAQQRLSPILSNNNEGQGRRPSLPVFKEDVLRPPTYNLRKALGKPSAQRLASIVFSTSIGLSAVLVELLLCEISNTLDPAARGLALRITLTSLLVLNILVTPAMEIHGFAKSILGSPVEAVCTRRTKPRIRIILELVILIAWLLFFWYMPQTTILRGSWSNEKAETVLRGDQAFTEACLERVGIIGISLMASLAGFAAVSSLWQTFGVRHRVIRQADLSRKEAGLSATEEMLAAKQSRVRALQRKMSEAGPDQSGFMTRMISSVRGAGSEVQEMKALQMEVSGLETMRYTLFNNLSTLRTRHNEQQRFRTTTGKLLNISNTIFAVYCAYRIGATSLSSLRRWWQPNHSFATSDPINNILALLTTHWDPTLDRTAWSRQISFLLSGIMLLASFNAVLQTFRLFARFAPASLQKAEQQTSLPLVISQIAGTYVISSALLLRSNLPEEVGGVISEALGKPLEGGFVEAWFESWFLVAVGLTAVGILVGRKVGGGGDDEDDHYRDEDTGVEMGRWGKRH
ncbi:hypothetical protein LTR62_007601 [Meristemomyces frigidus]|uniref:G protein-coupled receptor n=1 Tax=Meristemomyces frigidus TaxID=1508187 RepID=A0AAN7TEF6_9PEZI|nr:hypothetical protein LTR62_007601 [Meristemomyces frigidus]